MRAPRLLLLAACAVPLLPCVALAQTCATPAVGDSAGIPVVIIAHVHADAVVFESDPDVHVTLNDCPPPSGATWTSLPDSILPGVRYTDVEAHAEYRVRLNIECRAPGDAARHLCEELTRSD